MIPSDYIIKTEKDLLMSALKKGEGMECPVCGQFCKIYKVPLNKGMVNALLWIYKEMAFAYWVNLPEKAPREIITSRSHGKLLHWGLVEQQPNDTDPTKKCSGLWRVTRLGVHFIHGRVQVPRYVFIYDGKKQGNSDELIDIKSAGDEDFDYEELMRSTKVLGDGEQLGLNFMGGTK